MYICLKPGFTLLVCGDSGWSGCSGCVVFGCEGSGGGMAGVIVLHMLGRAARLGSCHLDAHQLEQKKKKKKRKKEKTTSQV